MENGGKMFFLVFVFLVTACAFADEQVTLTTYYPHHTGFIVNSKPI